MRTYLSKKINMDVPPEHNPADFLSTLQRATYDVWVDG
jgi:hypothetical protein